MYIYIQIIQQETKQKTKQNKVQKIEEEKGKGEQQIRRLFRLRCH